MDELLDLSAKGLLRAGILPQAESEEERKKILSFLDRITDEQAAQLLAMDGYAEDYKIPVWDSDLGGPAKDANREHDTPPDRFIDGKSLPRNITDDLYIIFHGAKSFFEIKKQIETFEKLSQTNKQYWTELQKIFIPSVGGRKIDKISIPTDFINASLAWSQRTEGNKALKIPDKNKSLKETFTYCAINFEELKGTTLTRKLGALDEELYNAAANLYHAGNEYVSLSMLYNVYHDGNPRDDDLIPIAERITKMERTFMKLDNREEAEVTEYQRFEYSGSLLPIERVSCYINGKLVDQAIHFFREPPLFSYARLRGQLTTVPRKLLLYPAHRSDRNSRLNLYLIRIIKAAQNPKNNVSNRITYDTIFEKLELENPSLKSRTKGTIIKLFDFYKKEELITSYKPDAKGITFFWKQ